MANQNQTIRNYTQSLTEDTNRDANTVFYGANSSGDRKLTASKFMTLWSDTRTYAAGEVCFSSAGNTFRSLQNANINYDPEDIASATFWESGGGGGSGAVIGNIFPDPTGSKGNEGWTETSATVTTVAVGDTGFETELNILTTGAGSAVLNIPVPIQLRGEDMELSFEFFVTSGTPIIKFYKEDGTTEVPTSNLALPASGKAQCLARLFMTSEATINLKVSGTNIDCAMTNIYFGRHEKVYGAAIGPDTTFTPTLTNAGTSPSITRASYRQSGEFHEGSIKLVLGTSLPASEFRVGLPSNLLSASDYATLEVVGIVTRSTSIAEPIYALIEPSKGYLVFGRQYLTGGSLTKINANAFSASEVLSITFKVKMAHLVGAGVVQLAQSAGTMYLSNNLSTVRTSIAGQTIEPSAGNSYYGEDGSPILGHSNSIVYYDIDLPRSLLPNEVPHLELRSKVDGNWYKVEDARPWVTGSGVWSLKLNEWLPTPTTGRSFGCGIVQSPTAGKIRVKFSGTALSSFTSETLQSDTTTAQFSWATVASTYFDRWRIRVDPQNAVELPPKHWAKGYKTTVQTNIQTSGEYISWEQLSSSGIILTSSSRFTVRLEGFYDIKCLIRWVNATQSYVDSMTLSIRINGNTVTTDYLQQNNAPTQVCAQRVSDTIYLYKDDYIEFFVTSSDGVQDINSGSTATKFSITYMGK